MQEVSGAMVACASQPLVITGHRNERTPYRIGRTLTPKSMVANRATIVRTRLPVRPQAEEEAEAHQTRRLIVVVVANRRSLR